MGGAADTTEAAAARVPKAPKLSLSQPLLARMFALADSDSDGTVEREEFERMAHELAEGGGALAQTTFVAVDEDNSGAVDRAQFEVALAGVTAAQAEWWVGLRSEGAVELVAADGGVLAVTAAQVAQIGTISALVEAVPLGVRHSVAVPRVALGDAVELLRAGSEDGSGTAAAAAAAALPLTRLFQAIVALDFLDAPLSDAVVRRAAAAVPAAVTAIAEAAAAVGGAAAEAAVEAEPPVGEEELRHVIERTAAGSVIWAAMPGTVRLEALLLPAPLTPDPTEIRVADSSLGDAGAVRLAARLGSFPQLRVLELPGNNIGAAGMAALNTALEAGACPQLVELLGIGKNALSLVLAAQDGHEGAVGLLLRGGEDVDKAVGGRTALVVAANNGHEAVVGRLIAAGAAVDKALTTDGATPLFVAAQGGHEAVVGRLIAAGATVD